MSSSAPPAARVLRFDTYELDLLAGELRKRGIKLRLQGQPLQVLAILVQSAGNLVTREELRSQLWQVDTFVDFDHSLHNAIARIREALGDSTQTPKYIETLPRRGYRFIAQVEEVQPPPIKVDTKRVDASNQATAGVPPAIPIPWKTRWRISLIVALCACCLAAVAGWMAWQHRHAGSVVAAPRSIAVLPLQNLSGDPSQDFFADAMTDELITEVSRIQALRVISHTSVMEYKGTRKHLPQIARELRVDDIVEGSIIREGGEVRVTVQLLDAPNDRHLWSEDYQRPLGSILHLQKEIAQSIAQQVRVKLTSQQEARLGPAPAVNPQAYDDYLRGHYYLMTLYSMHQPLDTAKQYFEESIRKDSGFAPAYAGLANTYLQMALFRSLSPQDGYSLGMRVARKALGLDNGNAEAHSTLGMLKWQYERDWPGAASEFEYTIAIAPSYDCARAYHARYLAWTNRRDEAVAEITRARELNPSDSFANTESSVYFLLGDYPNLIEASRKGVLSDPNDWIERHFLGVGYEGSGRLDEAIPEYQKAVAMSGGDQDPSASLAHAYAMTGRRPEAEKILLDLERKSRSGYVSPYLLASINAGLGEKDTAIELLEKAYRERDMGIMWFVKTDPRIDNLRSDPRFQALLERFDFPR
jgi:TolB-like protein/DNA-binding winged helix-turn-helix (wHTH) protein/Flp pilus assembly protein TadD